MLLKKQFSYYKNILIESLVFISSQLYSQVDSITQNENHYIIIHYNVENYFHPTKDSINRDSDYTEEGKYKWNYNKYYTKRDNICRVISNIAEWETPILISLCEIENKKCLDDICNKLKKYNYSILHYDSKDVRGIDVAILYDIKNFKVLNTNKITGNIDTDNYTRDILMIEGIINNKDTIIMLSCHLPSKYGGTKATDWKRQTIKKKIQNQIDSIQLINKNANIIVIGDMNDKPKNDIIGLTNISVNNKKNEKRGTYKYKGKWETLDQAYISNQLKNRTTFNIYSPKWLLEKDEKYLGYKPKRTYVGYKYNKGYSDHLPIVLYIKR